MPSQVFSAALMMLWNDAVEEGHDVCNTKLAAQQMSKWWFGY